MTGGMNQLGNTSQLTHMSNGIASKVLATVNSDMERFEAKVRASQKSHDAMDDLIDECYNLSDVDVSFLANEEEDELDKMIRSQQSKRSRAKSKVMNLENYKTMMVGAIAENLLRLVAKKPKSTGGSSMGDNIGYTDEDLLRLAEFPEELKKAIRNVQSKKSIAKSKADHDENGVRWQQLLIAEKALKEIRDSSNTAMNEETRRAIEAAQMLEEVDTEELTIDDARMLLDKMKEVLANG